MKKKGIIFLVVLIVLGVVGYVIGMPYYKLHFSTVDGLGNGEGKIVYVPSGSSLDDLAEIISKEQLLDKHEFLNFSKELGLTDDKVEPGKYSFSGGMKKKSLIYALKNGNQEIKDVRITFNNCFGVEDMASKVAPSIECDSSDIVDYVMDPKTMEKYGFRKENIMALFLPDTYEVGEWDMTAEEFVQRMADEYKSFWNEDRKSKAAALNLEQSEIATLASILEAEQSINVSEWKTIAGLYLNRLKIGMLLQSDPTAKFCWGDELEGVTRLLRVHMQKDCPYNTYLYAGLPPGPIRMPSKRAMDAVLNYETHNYLYMCATPDNSGLHNFASTLSQHNANARKWQAYAREQGL
ncbi:MAG: endolytic transglycosylase MltG [Crocinitomicaceae bacterium]